MSPGTKTTLGAIKQGLGDPQGFQNSPRPRCPPDEPRPESAFLFPLSGKETPVLEDIYSKSVISNGGKPLLNVPLWARGFTDLTSPFSSSQSFSLTG